MMSRSLAKLLLFSAFSTAVACDDASKDAAPEPVLANDERATEATAKCDQALLAKTAETVARVRSEWSPSAGRVARQADVVSAALTRACDATLLVPFREALKLEHRSSGFALSAGINAATSATCPTLSTVASEATRRPGPERPAAIYDGCNLERFSAVVSRDEFIAAGASSGAVAFLGLGDVLQQASVPENTANALVRELVLESGVQPQLPDELELPSTPSGQPLREDHVIVVTTHGFAVGHLFSENPVNSEFGELLDSVIVEQTALEQLAAKKGTAEQGRRWVLAVDGRVLAGKLSEVLATLERANVEKPRLLVLTPSNAAPYRTVEVPGLPEARASETLSTLLQG